MPQKQHKLSVTATWNEETESYDSFDNITVIGNVDALAAMLKAAAQNSKGVRTVIERAYSALNAGIAEEGDNLLDELKAITLKGRNVTESEKEENIKQMSDEELEDMLRKESEDLLSDDD